MQISESANLTFQHMLTVQQWLHHPVSGQRSTWWVHPSVVWDLTPLWLWHVWWLVRVSSCSPFNGKSMVRFPIQKAMNKSLEIITMGLKAKKVFWSVQLETGMHMLSSPVRLSICAQHIHIRRTSQKLEVSTHSSQHCHCREYFLITNCCLMPPDPKQPTVRILRPSDSDLSGLQNPSLLCLITGFFPSDISVQWKLNGTQLDASQFTNSPVAAHTSGGFTMHSALMLPASERKDGTFSCVVSHESSQNPISATVENLYGGCTGRNWPDILNRIDSI